MHLTSAVKCLESVFDSEGGKRGGGNYLIFGRDKTHAGKAHEWSELAVAR